MNARRTADCVLCRTHWWRMGAEPLIGEPCPNERCAGRLLVASVSGQCWPILQFPAAGSIAEIVAERDRLRAFVDRMIRIETWGYFDVEDDGGTIQDTAEELGLIVKRPHKQPCEDEACECDGSPELFYLAWALPPTGEPATKEGE